MNKKVQDDLKYFMDITITRLPANYKQIIQDIMYEENGWGIEFSKLIPIETYYEYQKNGNTN